MNWLYPDSAEHIKYHEMTIISVERIESTVGRFKFKWDLQPVWPDLAIFRHFGNIFSLEG